MCLEDFEKMHMPNSKTDYTQLFEEIKTIGSGGFSKIILVRLRNQKKN